MKVLRIRAEGIPLYEAPFDISFLAAQRVQSNHLESVSHLFGNVYVNNVEAFIGINASGKTTALNVISYAYMILSSAPLNADYIPKILGTGKTAVFDIDFFAEDKIYHLKSEILKVQKPDGSFYTGIVSEKLWMKTVTGKVNKGNVLDFDHVEPIKVRDGSDEYLSDDVSIMIAVNKQLKKRTSFTSLAMFTNFNLFLPDGGDVASEIISLLDPTIEYITFEEVRDRLITKLKFYGQKELILYNPTELNVYLSSGTVKGVRVFTDAVRTLKDGGYLVLDEIENHFNRELVAALLRLFMSKRTNPKGAVIIFSTHYPDLLDEMERNDSIFITRSEGGLKVDKLSSLLKRNDMKKSEVYQSNFLGGTAPKYNALAALQKSIVKSLEE